MPSFPILKICLCLLFHVSNSQPEENYDSDPMDQTSFSTWTYGGNQIIPSFDILCYFQSSCFELRGGNAPISDGWVEKTFTTFGFHDVRFEFNMISNEFISGLLWTYTYDDNTRDLIEHYTTPTILPLLVDARPSQAGYWDNRPNFKIRFQLDTPNTTRVYISDFKLWGIPFTSNPTNNPTIHPTTSQPTTPNPTNNPSETPTNLPSIQPTIDPTYNPTTDPTINPTKDPTVEPTFIPTNIPTFSPSFSPTQTNYPTMDPTQDPSNLPTYVPTANPTPNPTSPEHQVGSTLATHSGNTEPKDSDDPDDQYTTLMIVIIALSCLFLIGCIAFVILYLKKHSALKKSRQRLTVLKQNDDHTLQTTSSPSPNDTVDAATDSKAKKPGGYVKQASAMSINADTEMLKAVGGVNSEIQLEGVNTIALHIAVDNSDSDDKNNDLWLNAPNSTTAGATPIGNTPFRKGDVTPL